MFGIVSCRRQDSSRYANTLIRRCVETPCSPSAIRVLVVREQTEAQHGVAKITDTRLEGGMSEKGGRGISRGKCRTHTHLILR